MAFPSRMVGHTLFARPWHGIGIEAPLSIARAALDNDRSLSPLPTPVVEVVAVAKRSLGEGEALDGVDGQSVGEAIRVDEPERGTHFRSGSPRTSVSGATCPRARG
jgi:predicted homoserine dehydrogenase-like protein